ncbi:N-acetyl-D-Glu racemase DgcA [Pectobacterium cacticida]|uniref:N-acetyl-D-Glu racemase DgcA n=1 Tax=Pectobacterium cacticida TaxID=69221 RepID=UPI003A8DEAEE
MMELIVAHECWPLRHVFTIARGSRHQADVVTATLQRDGFTGRGECLPYARYGESVESVMAQIDNLRPLLAAGMTRAQLQDALPAGAARNALDCAFWDLECKSSGQTIWQRAGQPLPHNLHTAYTLSLDTPENMQQMAQENSWRPLLKLKLADEQDIARVMAVRKGAPRARIIVDANEGWDEAMYLRQTPELARLGVSLIEQPLPAGDDDVLAQLPHPVPLCADESCHSVTSLADIAGRYEMVNIKLDKTGGLTEALRVRDEATRLGLQVMVGCMVSTSLSMAPAVVVAQQASVVDLDGPLLLAEDREHGLHYDGSELFPPVPALWG